ncbi:hypothetical protein CBS101457_005072 [Exobasidium rhododendri]|nr:hypothetical protein CBS101457_005072 [Exobasidium rhododendri]
MSFAASSAPSRTQKWCVRVKDDVQTNVENQKGFTKLQNILPDTVIKGQQTGPYRMYISEVPYSGTSGGIMLQTATLRALATAPAQVNVFEFIYNLDVDGSSPILERVSYWIDRSDACTVPLEDLKKMESFPWIGTNVYKQL